MNIDNLRRPLAIEDIDFRVQSINKGGYATILAYKDARVDMTRLDDVVGPLNWKREHLNNNHNCRVSIWNAETQQWVGKEDTGVESAAESEKGLASDSFKRACFNWGIGRELYEYPVIQIKLNADEFSVDGTRVKATWNLKLREWTWHSQFDDEGGLLFLSAVDQNGKARWSWGHQQKDLSHLQPVYDQLLDALAKKDHFLVRQVMDDNEHAREDIFNMAPSGKKTAFKNDVRAMYGEAAKSVRDTLEHINTALTDADGSVDLNEVLDELGVIERKYVFAALDEVTRRQIEQTLEAA